MAGRLRLSRCAWPLLALALALGSVAAWTAFGLEGAHRWGWHADQAGEPWRWWTAAVVHVNSAHLQANLWAAAVVAAWGWTARAEWPQALAWLLAWPLSQALLFTDPGTLARYVGLSATLHAGAAIGCWHLLLHGRGLRRAVGAAVAAAVAIKLSLEAPLLLVWLTGTAAGPHGAEPLAGAPGHVVAGHAHACGVMAGVLGAAAVDGMMALRRRAKTSP